MPMLLDVVPDGILGRPTAQDFTRSLSGPLRVTTLGVWSEVPSQ